MVKNDLKPQRGAAIFHWLVALIPLAAIGVFAIDLNDLHVAHTELQKAADAGALKGTLWLYCPDGTINSADGGKQCVDSNGNCVTGPDGNCLPDALTAAANAAQANDSQGAAVEVTSTERGHWEFMHSHQDAKGVERGGVFTAISNLTSAPLVDTTGSYRPISDIDNLPNAAVANCDGSSPDSNAQPGTSTDLNRDTCNVNSVRVCVARNTTPVLSFLGRLLGAGPFTSSACAVAYIGFSSYVTEDSLDAPIAICENKIKVGDGYSCTIATFTPTSDSSVNPQETAQWVNFGECGTQPPVNDSKQQGVRGIIDNMSCPSTGLNPRLAIGTSLNVNGGELPNATGDLRTKWLNCAGLDQDSDPDHCPDTPWLLKLPRVECLDSDGNAIPNGQCKTLLGTVAVQVLWVTDHGSIPDKHGICQIPTRMTDVSIGAGDGTTQLNWDVNIPNGGAVDGKNFVTVRTRFDTFQDGSSVPNGVNASFSDLTWTTCQSFDPADQAKCADGNNAVIYDDKTPYTEEKQEWDAFVRAFDMQIGPGVYAWWSDAPKNPYQADTYYFAPYCGATKGGGTGGPNFGVLAEVPVLVY